MSTASEVSLIRLMQLCSSALPIGGFTYSQGLEWTVECQWVNDEDALQDWMLDLINSNLQCLEIPVFIRMSLACKNQDELALKRWSDILLAYRETSELRLEEANRGRAMTRLLTDLELAIPDDWQLTLAKTQTAGFALAAQQWKIPVDKAAYGFAWSWLENLVISAVKLIPLGQVSGQRVLQNLAEPLAKAVEQGMMLTDDEIGSSSPALAYASARHETQYTRLFRS